jgi:hypothetical protein
MKMKCIRSIVAVVALAVLAVPHSAAPASPLSQLRGMEELKAWFNAYQGRPRLILLLSPT